MSTTTENIKARLNIVEVVGQYVRLQKAGNHWKANCPFHQEKSPSFTVSEERNMWHCFGCGKGGDVFAFVMEIEGIEFREALTSLAERAGVELPQYDGSRSNGNTERKSRSFEILELATKFYEKQLWEGTQGKKMLDYLHGRGLTDETLRAFRIGYAPDGWRFVMDFLLKRGFAVAELEQAGLVIRKNKEQSAAGGSHYDRFRDRIMFPIGDVLGRVIGYSARVAPGGDESQAKYVNTSETDVYHKSKVLYGLHLAKKAMKDTGHAIIVEGNVDVMALHQAGLAETVAVSGTALTAEQLTLIKRYVNKVSLFFDMDSAGQKAAWKSAALAQEMGLLVEIIALSSGKDAADMGKENPEELKATVKKGRPAMDYFLEKLIALTPTDAPEGKRQVVEQYVELLASVSNDLERAHWTKTLAERIGSESKIVSSSVEKLLQSFRRGTNFVEPVSTKPFLPKSFQSRSEMLRESIIGLMLVGNSLRERVLGEASASIREFLALHPLFFFLQNEAEDTVGTIEDEALQKEASRLLFQALALPALASLELKEERETKAKEILEEYLALLPSALETDKRRELAQKIEAARASQNKEQEKTLLLEFSKLMQGNS